MPLAIYKCPLPVFCYVSAFDIINDIHEDVGLKTALNQQVCQDKARHLGEGGDEDEEHQGGDRGDQVATTPPMMAL